VRLVGRFDDKLNVLGLVDSIIASAVSPRSDTNIITFGHSFLEFVQVVLEIIDRMLATVMPMIPCLAPTRWPAQPMLPQAHERGYRLAPVSRVPALR
jgi:hypothetical protein